MKLNGQRAAPRRMQFARAYFVDREWALIESMIRQRRLSGGRPSDDRRSLDAMLFIAWSRFSWRKLPERYGRPNSVARTFARWCEDGTIDALLNAFPSHVSQDEEVSGVVSVRDRLGELVELQRRHSHNKRRPLNLPSVCPHS